ncbi:MAG: DUF4386 domain-containing protein [Thaumarchaeota archaeon]|nr:DUF4386 domain-containing protein [Nitrososphaerota archaeon]
MTTYAPERRAARVAGVWYLLLAIAGIFAYKYVPSLIASGNATATASNFMAYGTVVRIGIVAELTEAVLSIFLVRALYRLLSGVNRSHASLMVTLVLVAVPIDFVVVLNEIAALMLYGNSSFLSVFGRPQLDAFALMFLDLHAQGLYVVSIFWGLWLFPFGVLVFRSGFIPRVLGVLLVINGFAYLAIGLVSLVLPPYANGVSQALLLPEALGELSIMLWLLIRGVRVEHRTAPSLAESLSL